MTIAFVGFAEGEVSGTNVTPAQSAARAVTAGNLLVVGVSWEGGGANDPATATVTDTAGNTYTLIGSVATTTGGTTEDQKAFLYYVKNCLGHASNVVSATPSAARGAPKVVMVAEYSYDAADIDLIDFEVSELGSNAATANTPAMTAQVGDLLAAHIKWNTSAAIFTVDSGYTARATHSDSEYFDQIVGTAGSYTPGGDFTTGTDSHAMVAALFREASGTGVEGDLAATEGASDTAAVDGDVIVTGSAAPTEGATDTAAVDGDVLVTGSQASTEGADTAAAEGDVLVAGDLASTDGQDAAAIDGDVLVAGDLAATEAEDAAAISGRQDVTGDLAATEAGDSFAATGTNATEGELAALETGADAAAIAGEVPIEGAAASTDQADTAAISGSLETDREGDLAALETADGFSAAGELESWYSTDFATFRARLRAGETMSSTAFKDQHDRFAKRLEDVAFVYVTFEDDGSTYRLTKAEYDSLRSTEKEDIKNAGVSVTIDGEAY